MIFRNRALARIGAGAFGLVAVGAFATPAFADDTADVQVKFSGTTIAAGASGKLAFSSLINNGPAAATGLTITVDFSELDTELVDVLNFGGGCDEPANQQLICGITADELKSGEDFDIPVALVRKGGSGSAGSITISVETESSDPNLKNNTVTAPVTVGGNGPDLYVWAADVPVNEDGSTGSLQPGETGPLVIEVGNQGDRPVAGFKVTATLPQDASFDSVIVDQFPDDFAGCEFTADKAVCDWTNLPLIPADQDESEEDDHYSAYTFALPVKVADDAEAGVNLTGGLAVVEGYEMAERLEARRAPQAVELPQGVEGIVGGDVDATDNSDEFTVFVKAAANGGGGGLPVTGVQASLLGGIGLAVVAAGGAMFLISRRRRVVLVTPGDEKPTA